TAALIALAFASGVGARGAAPTGRDADPDDERPDFFEGALVSLGFLYHGVLSLKGRLRRILIWRRDAAASRPAGAPGWRPEPRLADAAPAADFEAPEEEEDDEPLQRPTRKAARPRAKPTGRKADGFELPPVSLLAAPKAMERYAPNQEVIKETATAL